MTCHDLEHLLGRRVLSSAPIGEGAAGSARRLRLDDGSTVILKEAARGLDLEARSLNLLAERSSLPVPRVIASTPTLLAMEDLGARALPPQSPTDPDLAAAEMLAALHAVTSPHGSYGLEFDNFIGPLPQLNAPCSSWVEFWRERRLMQMAHAAARESLLDLALMTRLEQLAHRLGELIPDRPRASLIHGDIWSGNIVRAPGGAILGFIDPSPAYVHAEVELAFITMFGTFGARFFDSYFEHAGVTSAERNEFERRRRTVYLCYPLLTHQRIYRGGYDGALSRTLSSLGL